MAGLLGGVRNSTTANSNEIDDLARFAVDQHNKKENKMLKLARVVKAQEQVEAEHVDFQSDEVEAEHVDDRPVDELVSFINGENGDSKEVKAPKNKKKKSRRKDQQKNAPPVCTVSDTSSSPNNAIKNKMLKLARVVKAQEQVVSGTMHHITLEVDDAGGNKIYLAKIWVKPWENFKQLQEFNHIPHPDHDVQKDGEGSGYQSVPVHDPVVQDAANHLLKTLQQRSNSLYPYELQEVVHAKAETVEGSAKYDILVKLKRNDKEEKYKANVHKDNDGNFHVNNMVQDHS